MRSNSFSKVLKKGVMLLLPVAISLGAGAILIILSGKNPFLTYINLFDAGFTCHNGAGRCALLTTLQFATPLIFSGLSALVALRAGFFSIGQAGQMLFGAAAAAWVGGHIMLPQPMHPIFALLAAACFGALWGLVPAILREYIGVNEIISTLLLNSVAGVLVGLVRLGRLSISSRLLPLVVSTKVTAGIILAVLLAIGIYIYIWKTGRGLELRNTAQAPRFALYGGIAGRITVFRAMALSGALAGLAGAVEVLGVQYKFVTTFSAISDFDGLIVAFAGHLHPAGVLLLSFLLGGLRAGSIVGLQIRSGIPRELGGALIALLLIFAAMHKFYRSEKKKT
jgi:general nucleoside transport system permease protein